MEEKNSQEAIETIEFSIDIKDLLSEMKGDILSRTKQHRKNIDRIIVPQYIDDQYITDNYVVTYSKRIHDNSVLGWTINNIEEDGQQQPDVYFKLDQNYAIVSFELCKKT